MNSKMLVLAAIGIVVATSLVMVGTITVHSAEASGPGCPNKRAATTIVDPNAVNTHTPTSPQSQLTGQTV